MLSGLGSLLNTLPLSVLGMVVLAQSLLISALHSIPLHIYSAIDTVSQKKHPMALGENEIRQLLAYLVQSKYVSSSIQNQALNVRTAHRTDKITCPHTCPEMLLFRIFLLGTAALFSKGTKRTDTLSDHSQNFPDPIHLIKIYNIGVPIATKNPDVCKTSGLMGRG
jgi:hypothetical protein